MILLQLHSFKMIKKSVWGARKLLPPLPPTFDFEYLSWKAKKRINNLTTFVSYNLQPWRWCLLNTTIYFVFLVKDNSICKQFLSRPHAWLGQWQQNYPFSSSFSLSHSSKHILRGAFLYTLGLDNLCCFSEGPLGKPISSSAEEEFYWCLVNLVSSDAVQNWQG